MKTNQQILVDFFEAKRSRNSQYSLRAFARDLNVSPAALSLAISGQREPSLKIINSLKNFEGITEADREQIMQNYKSYRIQQKENSNVVTLSLEQYERISDWHHYAILNLLKCSKSTLDPKWISERLGITEETAEIAIENLKELNVIKKTEAGWQRVSADIRVPTKDSSAVAKSTHKALIAKALETMEENSFSERVFSGFTYAASPDEIEMVRDEIFKFEKQLASKLQKSSNQRTDVFQLCIQFFPLTRLR